MDEEGKYRDGAGPGLSGLPVLDEGNNTVLRLLSRSAILFGSQTGCMDLLGIVCKENRQNFSVVRQKCLKIDFRIPESTSKP